MLDTPAEDRFDRITRIAALAFDLPVALVSLVDENRQWFKSCVGLGVRETPRSVSFCGHAIMQSDAFVIDDAHEDPRFADNPLVTGPPFVRFYAGQPLVDEAGHKLGTLCVIGHEPRRLTAGQIELLGHLGRWAEEELRTIGLEAALRERSESMTRLEEVAYSLRQSEEIHRSVVTSMHEGICTHDIDGVVTTANPAAGRILGVPAEELLGRPLLDSPWRCLSEDGSPFDPAAHPVVIASSTGERCTDVVMAIDAPGRPLRWITVSAHPLRRDDLETPWAVLSTFEDVTERRAVDQMKNEFVSVVSHELRTPLTSIRGALGLLASGVLGELPDRAGQMLDLAVSNTDRLVRLINDILDIERMESGKADLNRGQTDVSDLVVRTLDALRPMAEQAGVALRSDAEHVIAWLDADRVTQVLTNLVSNAIKFSPAGQEIVVHTAANDGVLRLAVIDHGRGVPLDKVDAIFERFQQVDASDSRDKGGTGLGLAICRSIMEQHGGSIWVEPTDGGGSTFLCELPMRSCDTSVVRPVAHTGTTGSGTVGPRVVDDAESSSATGPWDEPLVVDVVLVEDDPSLAVVLVELLASYDMSSKTVRSLAEARHLLGRLTPNLMLVDLGLPDGDGTELIAWLLANGALASIPVLVYTARDLEEDDQRSVELQHAEIHTKGRTDPQALISRIAEHLGDRRPSRKVTPA
ncbi:MAG: ATP-binding protein [Acidimicrobiia bacterium]|nr:ATP-binding protein [Acidimicrobiia bacterium]